MTHGGARGRPKGSKGRARTAAAGRGRRSDHDTAPADPRPVLLLGIGNILYGDEGLGVYLVHRLRRAYRIPSSLRIIDGGAAGWHLEPSIVQARRVLTVAAVTGTAGSIYRFSFNDTPPVVRDASPMAHETAFHELLTSIDQRGELPPTRIVAMGITPTEAPDEPLSMGLTSAVEARLPALELVLLAELADADVLLEPRGRPPSESVSKARPSRRRSGQHA